MTFCVSTNISATNESILPVYNERKMLLQNGERLRSQTTKLLYIHIYTVVHGFVSHVIP